MLLGEVPPHKHNTSHTSCVAFIITFLKIKMKRRSPSPDDDDDFDNANEHGPAKYRFATMQRQPPPEEQPRWRSAAPMVGRPSHIGDIGGGVDRYYSGGAGGVKYSPPGPKASHEPSDDIRREPSDDIRREFEEEIKTGQNRKDTAEKEEGRTKQRPSNWFVKEGSLKHVPTYYPLEKSSRYVTGTKVEDIASKISDACRVMSVHAEYDLNEDVPVSSVVSLLSLFVHRRKLQERPPFTATLL